MKWLKLAIGLGGIFAAACGLVINLDENPPAADADSDSDSDADSDADSDVDSDSDTDTGSDTASDTDTETEGECARNEDCGPDGDRDVCTFLKCHNYRCEPAVNACDDGVDCTDDSCLMGARGADPLTGCRHLPVDAICLSTDACHPSFCEPGAWLADASGCAERPVVCDAVPCSTASCSSTDGGPECIYGFGVDGDCGAAEICVPGSGCVPLGDPCVTDDDCAGLVDDEPCADWACDAGFCTMLYVCDGGQWCDPLAGCVPAPAGGG